MSIEKCITFIKNKYPNMRRVYYNDFYNNKFIYSYL